MLTDTHCHLDLNNFDEDRDMVIQRAHEAGVERMLIPSMDLKSCQSVIKLAESHPSLFAAVGFHPTELDTWNENSINDLRILAKSADKVIAIGEIGLDYYWVKEADKQVQQRNVLSQQLKLAQEVNKPVIIHMREENDAWFGQASIDLLEIITEWHKTLTKEVTHLQQNLGSCTPSMELLKQHKRQSSYNFYIGVTGPVTYKKAEEKRQVIRQLPLESLLIETDSPFLPPVPHRGRRNEPAFVAHIADKIAEIHMTTREQVAQITTMNANRLFGWGG